MRTGKLARVAIAAIGIGASASPMSAQRKVVVSHDEWFTQTGFFNANEQRLVSNVLKWFRVGNGGSALIYSNDPLIANSGFTSFLSGLGITATVNASASSFSGYGVVFAEGNSTMNASGLASYAHGGGNVFYMGGTGVGGAASEAAYSNPFLNLVGLNFAPVYNGLGTVNTSGFAGVVPYGPAIFTGVSSVYANNGSNISFGSAVPGGSTNVFYDDNGNGVFGVTELSATTPEPATWVMFGTGLLVLAPAMRRRKKRD